MTRTSSKAAGVALAMALTAVLGLTATACSGKSSDGSDAKLDKSPSPITPSASVEPPANPPSGSAVVHGSAYTFFAPKGWKDATATFQKISPTVEQAYADAPRQRYANNLDVLRADQEPKMTAGRAEATFAKELAAFATDVHVAARTSLGDETAVHTTGKGRFNKSRLTFDQFASYVGGHWYAVTFTFLATTPAARKSNEINQVLTSWRWTGA